MDDKPTFSKTVRIDLGMDAVPSPRPPGPSKAVSALAKMNMIQGRAKQSSSPFVSRYQELLQSLYDATLITTLSGRIVDVNHRAVRLLRYKRPQLCQMTIFDIISGSDMSLIETLYDNLELERFTVIQAYCIRQDSSYFPAEIAVNSLRLDEIQLCFFMRDITMRKEAEMKILTQETALQSAASGIVVVDPQARITFANPAFVRIINFDRNVSLMGRNLRGLFSNPADVDALIGKVLQDQGTWQSETRLCNDTGEETTARVTASCIRAEGGPSGLVFSVTAVGGSEANEEALQKARQELEQRMNERTAALARDNRELTDRVSALTAQLRQCAKTPEALQKE